MRCASETNEYALAPIAAAVGQHRDRDLGRRRDDGGRGGSGTGQRQRGDAGDHPAGTHREQIELDASR